MRVLLPIIYHSLTECIARAFQDEGHEVHVVNWRKHQKHPHKIEPFVIEEAAKFKPDLAWCQFQAPGLITSRLPIALKNMGCFSVNWAGDVRLPIPDWYVSTAPHFDVTSFSNMTDVDTIRKAGHRAEFLQCGYDPLLYNNEGAGERSGVVFLGNNYGGYKFAESNSRRDMVKALAEAFPDQFMVYGMSWDGIVPANNFGGYIREPDDARILRDALVAVGWDHFHRPWFASDRLLRATACGCATINQHYEGIEVEHPFVGSAKSVDDMVKMVRHALNNPEEAKKLGALSAENTLRQHTWNERVATVESWMNT